MPVISTVTIDVPATTANLGPGFDCLGAALTLSNRFRFSLLNSSDDKVVIAAKGLEAERVGTDASNLAYQAFAKLYQNLGHLVPAVRIEIELGVPLARGLGSSATAIVGGLLGANALAGSVFSQRELLDLAVHIEGHPDNVAPALLGGCCLAATGEHGWEVCDISWHQTVVPVVAIPNFELPTQEARQVLPTTYSRADATFNTAHLGLLVRALETGKAEWLKAALQDRVHQPYRAALIPGYEAVQAAALEAEAYGVVISGAGPTLLALTNIESATSVKATMAAAWLNQGISARVEVLQVNTRGAVTNIENLAL